jgi:hypothetical protein
MNEVTTFVDRMVGVSWRLDEFRRVGLDSDSWDE